VETVTGAAGGLTVEVDADLLVRLDLDPRRLPAQHDIVDGTQSAHQHAHRFGQADVAALGEHRHVEQPVVDHRIGAQDYSASRLSTIADRERQEVTAPGEPRTAEVA